MIGIFFRSVSMWMKFHSWLIFRSHPKDLVSYTQLARLAITSTVDLAGRYQNHSVRLTNCQGDDAGAIHLWEVDELGCVDWR